ncbi:MAG: hypothetical protein OQL16_01925 [Gammaproteobacteria bacterium]|nr:hypothetical protein [Gammaproteobacteria bacterium]
MIIKSYATGLLIFVLTGFNSDTLADQATIEFICIEKAGTLDLTDEKYDEYIDQCIAEAEKKAASD